MATVRGRALIEQHSGRISNASPHLIGQGAQEQDNLMSEIAGQLTVRKGCRIITITNAASTSASDVISLAGLHRPESRIVVYETLSGDVRIARGPA